MEHGRQTIFRQEWPEICSFSEIVSSNQSPGADLVEVLKNEAIK